MRTEFRAAETVGANEYDGVQAVAYLLELSLDWIVLRASENVHHLLGKSHVTLIDEPLGRFVQAQALHDLRNLFSRLSGTTGVARAYRTRLTDEPELFDLAFQLSDGRVLLEAIASPRHGYGEAFGTVGGLIAGLGRASGQALLDGGARRMRALTGYDRVTLNCGERQAESSRGRFPRAASTIDGLPFLTCDSEGGQVPLFPRRNGDEAPRSALMPSPSPECLEQLREQGVRAAMVIPFTCGDEAGQFRCDSQSPRSPDFETHAAAELFAQMFALRMEAEGLRGG